MGFPSDTPVYPGGSEGNRRGSTLGESDMEVFEVRDASHFRLGTLQEKPSPLHVMRQLGWGIDREIYLVWDLQETGLTKQQQQPLPSFSFTRHIEPFTLVLCSHATPVDAVLLKSSVRGGQQPDLLGNRLLASLCCFENVF